MRAPTTDDGPNRARDLCRVQFDARRKIEQHEIYRPQVSAPIVHRARRSPYGMSAGASSGLGAGRNRTAVGSPVNSSQATDWDRFVIGLMLLNHIFGLSRRDATAGLDCTPVARQQN